MKTYRIAGLIVVLALAATVSASGQGMEIPERINYQGRLIEGTNLYNGTVELSFRLYDAPTGGFFPYCEDSGTVSVVDGLYSAYIGDDVVFGSLDNALIATQVWIEVVVVGSNNMTPRGQLGSVGFAR